MRKLNLQGRLDIMSGLVGTLTNDDGIKQSVIIALLPDSLPKKKLAEEKARIRTEAEKHFLSLHGLETERLSNLFDRLAQPQSTLEVRGGQPAGPMLDFLLEDEAAKNVIFCHDKTAYLEVCSELGISRDELLNIAELSSLLPEETKEKKLSKFVGRARDLCQRLSAGTVPIFTGPDEGKVHAFLLSQQKIDYYVDAITQAQKYNLGDFGATEQVPLPVDTDKCYLPYNKAYFEFTITDDHQARRFYFLCERIESFSTYSAVEEEKRGASDDMLVSMFIKEKEILYMFPFLSIVRDGALYGHAIPHDTVHASNFSSFRNQAKKMEREGRIRDILKPVHVVLSALEKINEPRYQPVSATEILTVKQKKQEKKGMRKNPDAKPLPLFSYYSIKFNEKSASVPLSDTKSREPIQSGKKETQGLWEQPLHKRKGHKKTIHYKDGTTERRTIDAYSAGNPEVGIICRTEKRQPV